MSSAPDRFGGDPAGPDDFADWDAAYVLGALSPAERRTFEEHLAGCTRCREGVAEIAGVPGLLSQVGPEDAAWLLDGVALSGDPVSGDPGGSDAGSDARVGVLSPEGPPATLLPQVLSTVQAERDRSRRRLTRRLVGLAAALVLVLGGVVLGQVWTSRVQDGPQLVAFAPVETSQITANAYLVPLSSGTDVRVECQYVDAVPVPPGTGPRYSIVVTDRSGRDSVVKDWPVSTGKVMRPSGTTALSVAQIASVEIRETASARTVLRADLR